MEEKDKIAIDKIFNSFREIYNAMRNIIKSVKRPGQSQDIVYANINTINNELSAVEEASEYLGQTYVDPPLINTLTKGSTMEEYHNTMINHFEFQVQVARGRMASIQSLLDSM